MVVLKGFSETSQRLMMGFIFVPKENAIAMWSAEGRGVGEGVVPVSEENRRYAQSDENLHALLSGKVEMLIPSRLLIRNQR